jgi:hypothetical protein
MGDYWEDLDTAYTETVDEGSDVTCNDTGCVVDTLRRDADARVMKDFGEGYFGEFTHQFATRYTQSSGAYVHGKVWMLSLENETNPTTYIKVQWLNNTTATIFQLESGYSGSYFVSNMSIPINTWVYCVVARNESNTTMHVYNDSAHTDLRQFVEVSYNGTAYRYATVVGSRNLTTTDASTISFATDNYDFQTFATVAGAMSFYGVSQTDPIAAIYNATVTDASENIAVDITGIESQWEVAAVTSVSSGDWIVANNSQTERFQTNSWGSVLGGFTWEFDANQTRSSAYVSEAQNKLSIVTILNPVTLDLTPEPEPPPAVFGIILEGLTHWGCDFTQ